MELNQINVTHTQFGTNNEWPLTTISEVAVKVGSGSTPRGGDKVYVREGHPFIRSQNVGWGELLLSDLAYIDEETHSQFSSTEIVEGDVLLNITGASIGRGAIADDRISGGNVNQHVCIIRTSSNKLNSQFLLYYLLSEDGQKQIDSFQAGGNRQGLNFQQIRSFYLPHPSLNEQVAVANVLSDVDALLAKLDQLIAKKSDIKKGAMQELLTGKRRLPGYSKPWGVVRLREIGSTYGGLSGKSKTDFENGKSHYIPFTNVMSNVTIDMNQLDKVSIKSSESQNTVRAGDLIFNGSSETPDEVGYCSAVMQLTGDLYLNSFCFGFRPREVGKVCPLFLAYYFRGPKGREIMSSLAQGSTRYNLSKNRLLNVDLNLPDLVEQEEISAIFSDMDSEIHQLKTRRAKIANIKQGMMQQLLTGKIRLV